MREDISRDCLQHSESHSKSKKQALMVLKNDLLYSEDVTKSYLEWFEVSLTERRSVNMIYVGLDLHKDYSFLVVIREDGALKERIRLPNDRFLISNWLSSQPKPLQVAVEATWNWYWLLDLLQGEEGVTAYLSHPKKLRAIAEARIKTDKIDALVLAQLLRADLLPCSYIADPATRDLRELLRRRVSLSRDRALVKNRIRGILAKYNYVLPFDTPLGKKARVWLKELGLPLFTKEVLLSLIRQGEGILEEIEGIERLMEGVARAEYLWASSKDPVGERRRMVGDLVRWTKRAVELLVKLPGIGLYLALLILAEAGDITRFRNSRAFSAFTGLVASVHQSGKLDYHGHITKEGNRYLRWALVQAAHKAKRYPGYSQWYQKVRRRRKARIAEVALARRMGRKIYHLLNSGVADAALVAA
jgi:transposase